MKLFVAMFFAIIFPFMLMADDITVTDDITSNTTWTSDNVYFLDGLIFVDSLNTLTIEAGTVIKGLQQSNITTGDGASALIVRRGAMIDAEGTAENPIIFTSQFDDVENANDLTETDRGLWGGVILLGKATTNQPTNDNQIEGIPPELNARYGGNDDADNSGTLRYVSIRHGGFSISGQPGDEINGLTMGAVGSGTTIDHIEVFANFDDGYEWFGGTVNTKNLVAAFCGDDAFDYDQGFRGKGQFWFAIQGADEAGRGGEHDGGDDDETGTPYSMPLISNVTYIGAGKDATPAGDGNDRALYFRDNAGGKYWNSIFTDFTGIGLKVEDLESGEDSRSRLEKGDLLIENNLWWNFGAGNTVDDLASDQFVADHLSNNANQIVDPQLNHISRANDQSLDPRPNASGPAASGATIPEDDFYTDVDYYGAFQPDASLWTQDWTALSSANFTDIKVEDKLSDALPKVFHLDQNYPNPFNPETNITFRLPKAADVNLTIYNMLGQKVETIVSDRLQAGSYTYSWNAENLPSGVYVYRIQAGNNTTVSKKMLLLK